MRIISIDPGRETGFCYAELENKTLSYHPFQAMDDVDDLATRLRRFDPQVIIIEDFEFRRSRYNSGLDLFPVQLIGVTRLYDSFGKTQLFIQKAATGKGYYTDLVLKRMDLY